MSWIKQHIGEWISISAHLERRPPRFTLTITLGELPDGWARTQRPERTWAAIIGLLLLAPFIALLAAGLLRALGLMNLWRITRVGLRRDARSLEGLLALEFAPLHLVVVLAALLIGGAFAAHLAIDSYACLTGVRSAC